MQQTGYLLLTKRTANDLLSDVEDRYVTWYRKTHKVKGDPPGIDNRSIKYWKDVLGRDLQKAGFISSYRMLYDINLFTKQDEKKIYEQKIEKNYRLFTDYLEQEISYYGDIKPKKKKQKTTQKSDKQNPFSLTKRTKPLYESIVSNKWFLFSFDESFDEFENFKSFGISQAIIEFSENVKLTGKKRWQIKIWTEYKNQSYVYSGNFGFRKTTDNHVYLETFGLELPEVNKKHLRMMLYFGKHTINEIAIGVFYNIRNHGALLGGSILLVAANNSTEYSNIKNTKNLVKSHSRKSSLSEIYQASVWPFFERRNLNYLKLPNLKSQLKDEENSHTLKTLEFLMNKNKKNSYGKEVWLTDYNVFISIPLTHQNSKEIFDANKKIANAIIDEVSDLMNIGLKDFYFAAKSRNFKQMTQNKELPKDTILALERSNVYIMIVPGNKVVPDDDGLVAISSAFTELGYAMALKKRIFIFVEMGYEKLLPSNIELLKNQNLLTIFPFDKDSLGTTFSENKKSIISHFKIK